MKNLIAFVLCAAVVSCSSDEIDKIDKSKGYSDPDKIPSDLTKEEIAQVIQNPNMYHTTIFHSECKPHVGIWTKNCYLIDADITGSDLISSRKLDNVTSSTFCDYQGHNEK